MSTKDIQFTENKISVQQGSSYIQKTPFLIDDILHQRNNSGDQTQHKISASKISNVNNNGDNVITELSNKLSRNNHINDLMTGGNGQGSDEDYRKILQHER